jgi:tricorn protease
MRLTLLAAALLASTPILASETLLLRFPDISKEHVSFVYAGDIYVAARQGGVARKLTSHEGMELFPKFSPDGQWIAFSAEYSGTRQVWVVPTVGGEPRQLTYYNDVGAMPIRGGYDNRVLDWSADGKHILVRMNRLGFDERSGRYYMVPFAGGMEQALAIPEGAGGMFSPDNQALVYTPIDSDWRGWKRYRGGRAQDIWSYDLKADRATRLTDSKAQDQQPLWVGDKIYFVSDREFTLNLYSMNVDGSDERKVTDFKDFDVLWPSASSDAIVYERGGALEVFEPTSGSVNRLSITVPGDRPKQLPYFTSVSPWIESMALAPKAERVLLAARGEVYSVPAKQGEVRALTRTPSAREHSLAISPDGKQMVYLSDATGEYEFYLRNTGGSGEPRKLTSDGDVWRFAPVFAPDGKSVLYADKKLRLRLLDIATGEQKTLVQIDRGNEITEYSFAPDSKTVLFTLTDESGLSGIHAIRSDGRERTRLSDPQFSAFSPAFDPKGRYLYFLSRRDHNLTFSDYEFNYLYANNVRIFAATLSAASAPLNAPKSDEIGMEPAKLPEWDGKGALRFDLDGLDARAVPLKLAAGNYQSLEANATHVFYQTQSELKAYGIFDEKEESVLKGITQFTLAPGGEKLVFRTAAGVGIADAKPAQDASKTLDLSGLEARIEPKLEWQQVYVDGWRILRDWFYDEGLHGMDWKAIRDKYQPLVAHVAHREDLDAIFHEITGELNAGHVYVERGGNRGNPVVRRAGGLLGAEIEAIDGVFRISHIFPSQTSTEEFINPLRAPGINAKVGDYLMAVDGVSTSSVKNFYQLLENKAGHVVRLTLASDARGKDAREVHVKCTDSETGLRYLDWVETRRAMVDKLSGGRIGYIHVPNTAVEGNRELQKQLQWQLGKDALIIDDRYNGGGFIPDRLVEILARKPLNYWKRRGLEPGSTPGFLHDGPKAMLINGISSSGGDALPYYFRKLGLGPLIGTRTWGGLIGISGNPALADGGQLLAATFRFMDSDGNWAVENEGVAPDIEVIDAPDLLAKGQDPSLEKAVSVLLDELTKNPPRTIKAPPAPTQFGGES